MLLRIFYILIFISCIHNSFAQSIFNQNISSLNTNGKSFKQIIQQLEQNYNVSFSYSDDMLPDIILPECIFSNLSFEELLKQLFVAHGVDYSIVNGQIVLFYNEETKPNFRINGFIEEQGSKRDLIGATVYIKEKEIGVITNSYGYFSFKLPVGLYTFQVRCLGYDSFEQTIYVWGNSFYRFKLKSKQYQVNEVVVKYNGNDEFVESAFQSLISLDIKSLQEFPGLFGENDALRNLSLLPGIQSNEMSTGSVFVRGGSNEQTVFLMDEGIVYNPSHFGGFFSVFNPDVVNHVSIYKSELPSNETGALSSIVDVRLREGDFDRWKIKGGIGLISARASVEGPLVKDKSSILIAFRRTFVDQAASLISEDKSTQDLRFYFYDANIKFNYKFNKKNRIYLSTYGGADSFYKYDGVKRRNSQSTFRWNHVYNSSLFSNVSLIHSVNSFNQTLNPNDEEVLWHSNINTIKAKADFSHFVSPKLKLQYGFQSTLFNVVPYRYTAISESGSKTRDEARTEQMAVNSVYFHQDLYLKEVFGIGMGARIGHIYNSPFINRDNKYQGLLFEPNLNLSLMFNKKTRIKSSYNHREQPLHQLYINMLGIAVNRWMPASNNYLPQTSDNFSLGIFRTEGFGLSYSVEGYYRKLENLIETLQESRVLYSYEPEKFLHNSSGTVNGFEMSVSYETKKLRFLSSYDYNNVQWLTEGINQNNYYPASHIRKHNFSLSGVYRVSERVVASVTWHWASGTPFTAATGKYEVDGKVYLNYDDNKINTRNLPDYHRLDLSVDIEGKKNNLRRWKSFWNFSIYNAYFHKNVLGVIYFSEDVLNNSYSKKLDPSYFYLYQFVPSVSYRFNF